MAKNSHPEPTENERIKQRLGEETARKGYKCDESTCTTVSLCESLNTKSGASSKGMD